MINPLVSVILPVYNCEAYLDQAVASILSQSYQHLELIAINDGSTDGSLKILESFLNDPRIRIINNLKNEGLIFTLNRGISLSSGELIARMDGDDISLPERFTEQVAYLEQHPDVTVVATRIRLVDEKGNDLGNWKQEYERTSPDSIRSYLHWNNCIAHPTVMVRAAELKSFRYDPRQKLSEDYDLWLRMSAAGKKIAKLESVGLLHRILSESFTRTRSYNVFTRMSIVKREFAASQLRKGLVNGFVILTGFTSIVYMVAGWLKGLKQKIAG
ncbi:MAG: glycosyltransferase [Chitinophagaceae bacterium]|nr:MAG: glycosyltransferase [Chitinophagaceae bacterium]